jgi:hypothetical protein
MGASIRAVQGIHIQGHVPGPVHILVIADAVTAATLEAQAQDAADMKTQNLINVLEYLA